MQGGQSAPTHPWGPRKVARESLIKYCGCIALHVSQARPEPEPEPEPEPAPEPEPTPEPEPAPEAEGEISAESGDYAAQFQAKFFGA
eukprot:COSAG04_NODE_2324_length_4331_cov_2.850425_5_plen_87_part_00